jgi:acetolactate synthase I/II/III large subunit
VVIDVPKDVQNWVGTFQGEGTLPSAATERRHERLRRPRSTDEDVRGFFEDAGPERTPLIYAGGGVINARRRGAARSPRASAFPSSPRSWASAPSTPPTTCLLHMLGMHGTAYANYAVEDCDFLIAVGSRFDDRVAGKVPRTFAPNAKNIAHIDIDAAEIGKVKPWTGPRRRRWRRSSDLHGARQGRLQGDFDAWLEARRAS